MVDHEQEWVADLSSNSFLFNSTHMDLTSELLLKFPATQISTLKISKSRITIHPQAYGFNLCYLNMFKNLTADLDISNHIKNSMCGKLQNLMATPFSIFTHILAI